MPGANCPTNEGQRLSSTRRNAADRLCGWDRIWTLLEASFHQSHAVSVFAGPPQLQPHVG